MRFCNHCGKPVSEGNQFCDYCGAELRVGSNTVPVGSPFRPAADFDTQSAPTSQPGDNGFSTPGNIGAPKVGFDQQRSPSQGSEPSTASEVRVPANRTFSDLKFGRNSQHKSDPAPAKKKSPLKRIIAAVLVIVILAGFASYFAMEKLRQDDSSGTVKSAEEAIAYMAEMSDTYGYQNAASELTEKNTSTIDGDTYYRLQQNYHGIPVYGRTAVYITDEAGNQIAVTGNLCDVDESISLTPTITQEEAEWAINAYIVKMGFSDASSFMVEKAKQDNLYVYCQENQSGLAYSLLASFISDGSNELYSFLIDANSSNIVSCYSEVRYSFEQATCTASGQNDSESPDSNRVYHLDVTKDTETGYLHLADLKRNIIALRARNDTWQAWGFNEACLAEIKDLSVYPFYLAAENLEYEDSICWDEKEEPTDKNAIDAYGNIQITYDYFANVLNNFSTDGNGKNLIRIETNIEYTPIKYTEEIEKGDKVYNSFFNWKDNAGSITLKTTNGISMTMILIGNVESGKTSSASLSAMGHEYMHGVTQTHAGLTGNGEPAAINEALSDIFGELVESWYDSRMSDTEIEPVWIEGRNISDPSDTGNAVKYQGEGWKNSSDEYDSGNSHNNSTVISHAAYLMWNGGVDRTEEKKLSTDELAKLWYRAMLMMPSDCNFATCRTLVELAAQSMGLSDKKRECVAEAFDTVGIPTNGVPIYTVQSPTKLSVFDFEQKLCKDYKIKISPAIISADGAHYIGATHEYYVENREYNTLNLSQGLYAVILEDAGNTNNKFGFILIVTDSEDKKNAISIYTDFGWSSAVLDAYKETCDFYVKWVDGGGHAWRGPSDDYVETYELGNVSCYTTDYFEKHCRTYDENITTVAQLKEGLNSHFAASYADDFFKRLDPVEDNGRLYTYYEGPWGSGWESVDKIESIEKTGDHTCVLTVSGNAIGERLFGKIACEYKDGQYLFYPSVEYLYDEDGDNALPGEFAFFLASDADLSLPLEGTSAAETTEPSTTEPEVPESGGNATGMSYEEARSIYLDYFRNIDLESLRVPFSPYTDDTVQVFDFAHFSKEDYTIQSMLADIGNDGSYELLLIATNIKANYCTCYMLFTIHNGNIEQVLNSYETGGTFGGAALSVVFDTVTERHLIATESHGRDGMWYGVSTFTVFDCINQSYTEAAVLTSAGINLNPIDQYYQKEADKIRAADPYAIEEDGFLKYFLWNDTYVSKSEYEEQYNRYIAPMDDSYDLKDASFENLIP